MRVVVVTPPDLLVERDLVKQHLRVDGDAEDTLIDLYVAAACGHIDGPGAYLGRAIGAQTVEGALTQFPPSGGVVLPFGPVLSLVSITILDVDGVEQVLDLNDYRVVDGVVLPLVGGAFPSTSIAEGAVVVRWAAGYDQTPGAISAALLLMVGDLYQNREFVPTVSNTVENLLRPYRLLEV